MPTSFPIILLAKDKIGYQNLCKLVSIAYTEGFYYFPRIDKELLEKYSEGLICLSGPVQSPISYFYLNNQKDKALEELDFYKNLFKEDFYLEIQRHKMKKEEAKEFEKESWVIQKIEENEQKEEKLIGFYKELAHTNSIKIVATNDVHYHEKKDWKGHEILLNIQSGEACEIWERDSLGKPLCRVPNPKRKNLSRT